MQIDLNQPELGLENLREQRVEIHLADEPRPLRVRDVEDVDIAGLGLVEKPGDVGRGGGAGVRGGAAAAGDVAE